MHERREPCDEYVIRQDAPLPWPARFDERDLRRAPRADYVCRPVFDEHQRSVTWIVDVRVPIGADRAQRIWNKLFCALNTAGTILSAPWWEAEAQQSDRRKQVFANHWSLL